MINKITSVIAGSGNAVISSDLFVFVWQSITNPLNNFWHDGITFSQLDKTIIYKKDVGKKAF